MIVCTGVVLQCMKKGSDMCKLIKRRMDMWNNEVINYSTNLKDAPKQQCLIPYRLTHTLHILCKKSREISSSKANRKDE